MLRSVDIPFLRFSSRAPIVHTFSNAYVTVSTDAHGMIHSIVPADHSENLVFEAYGFAFNEYYDPDHGYYYPTHNEAYGDVDVQDLGDSVIVTATGWVSRSGRMGDMTWINTYTFYVGKPWFAVKTVRKRAATYESGVRDNSICFILDKREIEEHRLRDADGNMEVSPAVGTRYRPLRLTGARITRGAEAEMVGSDGVGVRITVLSFGDDDVPSEYRVIEGEGYSEVEFEWDGMVKEGDVEEAAFRVEILGWKR
jgi:hypothetical protein